MDPVTMIIVGLVIGVVAFVFAAVNMARGVTSPNSNFSNMIRGHLGAMVVMAVGGLIASIGVLLFITNLLNKIT